METSTTTKELATALCAFQSAHIKVAKSAENPTFKNGGKPMRYADLGSILESILPTLTENGLSVVQFPDGENGLTTRLNHISGEWMQATGFMRPVQATPQGVGSTITYARRYALCAVLGLIVADDDGNAASAPAPVQRAVRPTTAELFTAQAALDASRSKVELREVYDEFTPELKAVLKQASKEAAARIDLLIEEAAFSPAPR